MSSPNTSLFSVSAWEKDLQDFDLDHSDTPSNQVLLAAENGDLEKLKKLIEDDLNLLQSTDTDGCTALHRASSENHVEIIDYLLQKGANVSSKSDLLWEPLHSACQWHNKETAIRLIQNGANLNALSEGNQTPLHIAASHGKSYDLVQFMLMQPYIKTDVVNNKGDTPYQIAQHNSKYYNVMEMGDSLIDPIPD